MSKKSTKIVGGGRNVFEDLGIAMSPQDLLKADMAALVSTLIQGLGLTQAKAAERLGIDQPRVSKLLRGRLNDFSMEALFGYLTTLGHDIEVAVSRKTRASGGRMNLKAA